MRRKALSLGILAFALAAVAMGQGKVRVYVTDSKSWEVKGGVGVADGRAADRWAAAHDLRPRKSSRPSTSAAPK